MVFSHFFTDFLPSPPIYLGIVEQYAWQGNGINFDLLILKNFKEAPIRIAGAKDNLREGNKLRLSLEVSKSEAKEAVRLIET